MERLTSSGTSEALPHVTISKICKRLAEYENTGLSPNEIKKLVDGVKLNRGCDNAKTSADGKCEGYQRSRWDDEPAEMCKECKDFVLYEGDACDELE